MRTFSVSKTEYFEFQIEGKEKIYRIPLAGSMPNRELIGGFTYENMEGKQEGYTNVGDYTFNITSVKIVDRSSNETTRYYTIHYGELNSGKETLEISMSIIARKATITLPDVQDYYDGMVSDIDSLVAIKDIKTTNKLSAHAISAIKFLDGPVDVGDYELSDYVSSITLIDKNDVDVTANYELTYKGTLTKTRVSISLTAMSEDKIYDGAALTRKAYSWGDDDLRKTLVAAGFSFKVTVSGSQTTVGSSANRITSVTVTRKGVDVTDCLDIETIDGTLTITKAYILLLSNSPSFFNIEEPTMDLFSFSVVYTNVAAISEIGCFTNGDDIRDELDYAAGDNYKFIITGTFTGDTDQYQTPGLYDNDAWSFVITDSKGNVVYDSSLGADDPSQCFDLELIAGIITVVEF